MRQMQVTEKVAGTDRPSQTLAAASADTCVAACHHPPSGSLSTRRKPSQSNQVCTPCTNSMPPLNERPPKLSGRTTLPFQLHSPILAHGLLLLDLPVLVPLPLAPPFPVFPFAPPVLVLLFSPSQAGSDLFVGQRRHRRSGPGKRYMQGMQGMRAECTGGTRGQS